MGNNSVKSNQVPVNVRLVRTKIDSPRRRAVMEIETMKHLETKAFVYVVTIKDRGLRTLEQEIINDYEMVLNKIDEWKASYDCKIDIKKRSKSAAF